jgi:signal transduction histidine kinase/CheY-like chemotaxis protein
MRGEEIPGLYEFEILHREGRRIHVEASVTEIEYRDGKAILGLLRDVTEQRALEAQLNQTQRMESIGRLSGGVAHDLNNLLTPIIGYGEILGSDSALPARQREAARQVVQAAFRARDLVRQLLAFSRRQTLEFRPIDLNEMVSGFENLLRRTIREDIRIEFRSAPSLATIQGDRGQLEQVIMNLAVNAQDAMPDGGVVLIETSQVELDGGYAAKHPGVKPGTYVMLAISDSGHGMDDQTRERVFEPFFTTKDKSRGAGLGLATVYGIVKQHGGHVWVYSEPGEGATFKCYFPAVDAVGLEPELVQVPPKSVRGHETVMVVEDETLVRQMVVSILLNEGYSVLEAEDGEHALRLLENHQGSLHLLLTDVVLPGMNGKELFRRIVARFPGIRVLYMSGYTDNMIAHRGVLDEGVAFLQKPFSGQGLRSKVRQVLEQR